MTLQFFIKTDPKSSIKTKATVEKALKVSFPHHLLVIPCNSI